MRLQITLAIAAIATLGTATAQADVIFSDDFDTSGGSILNWDGGANWTVEGENATVDLVASGEYRIDCLGNTGHCVDMDGSTETAGQIVSVNLGPLASGDYEFSYWLSGNQRVSNQFDVVVALAFDDGAILSQQVHGLTGNDEWQQFTQTFSLTSVTDPLFLRFMGAGGDNIGILLDSVKLRSVPEPGTLALLGLGLLGVGATRRRKC